MFHPMHPDLERLITLQRIDSAVHDAERRLAEEPARLQALETRLEEARLEVAAAKHQLAENQGLRRSIEKELAVHQGRLSRFRDQLMSVKTNVEYQAMQKEIEFAQAEVKALEDRLLERMMEADDLSAAVKHAESALASAQKEVEADRRALAAELAELKSALGRLAEERSRTVAALDLRALAMFDLVARRRNGVAVAEARAGICTICHVRLRPQVFNDVRRNDQIIQCDTCQRILYFSPAPSTSPQQGAAQTAQ